MNGRSKESKKEVNATRLLLNDFKFSLGSFAETVGGRQDSNYKQQQDLAILKGHDPQ